MLAASPEVLRDKQARTGYAHMLGFRDACGANIIIEVNAPATSAKASLQLRGINGNLQEPVLLDEISLS